MRNVSWIKFGLFSLTIAMAILACEEKDDLDPEPTVFDFSGILLFDENGAAIGCHGMPCDDDWKFTDLSDDEKELLNFSDNIDPSILSDTGDALFITGYPMPIARDGDFFLQIEASKDLKLKIIAVDSLLQVYGTLSLVTNSDGVNQFSINESWFDAIPEVTATRLYFQFENSQGETVRQGYADIAICPEGVGGANYLDCLP